MSDELAPPCPDCRATQRAITWQRELLLDLANMLKINLKDLTGATAEDEWESLGQAIRERMQDFDVGS